MAVSVQTVVNQLNALFSNSSNARFDATALLAAVNAAIDGAWPTVKNVAVSSSVTLASTTYEYSPSATPEIEWGFSQAYVTDGSYPKVMLRGVRQRQSGTTWTIHVPAYIADSYSGETLHLLYNSRVARISSVSDTVELPMRYLESAAAAWLAQSAIVKGAQYSTEPYERLVPMWLAQAQRELGAARRSDLPQMVKTVVDYGAGGERLSEHV